MPPCPVKPEIVQKSKLVDQIKAMRSSSGSKDKQFFQMPPPPQQQGYHNAKSGRGESQNF